MKFLVWFAVLFAALAAVQAGQYRFTALFSNNACTPDSIVSIIAYYMPDECASTGMCAAQNNPYSDFRESSWCSTSLEEFDALVANATVTAGAIQTTQNTNTGIVWEKQWRQFGVRFANYAGYTTTVSHRF